MFETKTSDNSSVTMRSAVTQSYGYDLFEIGSGPASQRAAIQAAKLSKRVAVVEMKQVTGFACINTGTIPEISVVGKNVIKLTEAAIAYKVGKAT